VPLTESSSSRPLFGLSLWAVLIPLPVFAGMTMLLGVFALITPNLPMYPVGAFSIALSLFFMIIFAKLLTAQEIRSAMFYDDFFRVTGKGIDRTIEYPEIKGVRLVSAPLSYVLLGPRLEISLHSGESPLELHANPKNRILNLDLYSWLVKKAGETQKDGS